MKRILHALASALLIPIILFEEWGWRPIARMMARIGRLPLISHLEKKITGVSPGVALTLFLVPALVLLPFKFGALWLLAHGEKLAGVMVIIGAKLVSTALLGRLFHLTEPQLMTFAWFARAYGWWRTTKDRVMQRLRSSAPWQAALAMGRQIRQWFRRKE